MPKRTPIAAWLAVLGVVVAAGPVRADDAASKAEAERQRKLGRKLLTRYRAAYRRFTRDVVRTKSKPATERVRVVQKTATAMNALFKDHVKSRAMAEVLPEFAAARGIDLAPTIKAVIRGNPNADIQAVAVYTLAVHLHNTGRDEKQVVQLLTYVKQRLATVPYGETTLGRAAESSLYAFEKLAVGKTAPDVHGEDADGVKFRLSDYHGKVIVLRFWGDWCPFCRSMFPQERELVNALRDKPFVLLGVNSDPRARLKKAQKEKNLVWRSFWDGGTTAGPIARAYRVKDWPTIYVIDHRGIIRYKGEGVRGGRAKWLVPAVKKLLAEAARDAK
ncbi:MAG: peroxiredoxin family protein [Planctomycetaceae bacterium]